MNSQKKSYQIVAALLKGECCIQLVKQQGPQDPDPTWALPGGVVEEGELLVKALEREVLEETRLQIVETGGLLYIAQNDDVQNQVQSIAFVFEINRWESQLRNADPDQLVLDVRFLDLDQAITKLE